ncbi:aspartate/glutamate racemase family protein [Pusillimonas sp.]|uniref:aspartate/glutamate racemase family protein n=1 Tax=Pusillimonas sp. TaxID=3040095 RepID=UPI0029ADB3F2|nr:amino acid racemase [Pusillimonas sp.]MDX3895186.1 amino acid racemase [Pusillimonas sp.]
MSAPRPVSPMRRIGLVGGMSWESSALYYRLLNQAVQCELGGHHNAVSIMVTLDFQVLVDAAGRGDWNEVAGHIGGAANQLERAGADFMLLTANTAHQVFDALPDYTRLPALHIGAPTARALKSARHARVGIIGTRHVTESSFYADWMSRHAGIEVVPPEAADRRWLDAVIFDELAKGRVNAESRAALLAMLDRMRLAGLDAVIVACTELPLLLAAEGAAPALPCFDTVALHVAMAVDVALGRAHIACGEDAS